MRVQEYSQTPESPSSTPKLGRRRALAAFAIASVVGAVAGVGLSAYSNHKADVSHERVLKDEERARDTIATHRFLDPRLVSVTDTGKRSNGQDAVNVQLALPDNPAAIRDMKSYANSGAVVWDGQPKLDYALITPSVDHGPDVTDVGYIDVEKVVSGVFGEDLRVKDGVSDDEIFLRATDPIGTKIALYTTEEAHTTIGGTFVQTSGAQYVGAIELVKQNDRPTWKAMPVQLQLPDLSHTITEPSYNP